MFADAGTSVSTRLSVNSSGHSEKSYKKFPVLHFTVWIGILVESRRFPDASSSLRKRAGPKEVLDESCGNYVDDALAQELNKPDTTTNTTFYVLHGILFPLSFCHL